MLIMETAAGTPSKPPVFPTKTVAVPVYTEHSMTVTEYVSVEVRATLPPASSGLDKCSLMFLVKMRHTNATSGRTNMTGKITAKIDGRDIVILNTDEAGARPVYLNTADNYIENDSQENWTYTENDVSFNTETRSLTIHVVGQNIKTEALSDLSINFEQDIYLEESMA